MLRDTNQSGNRSLLWVCLCRWLKENLISSHLTMCNTFILSMRSKWKPPLSSLSVLLQLAGKPGVLKSCVGGKRCPWDKARHLCAYYFAWKYITEPFPEVAAINKCATASAGKFKCELYMLTDKHGGSSNKNIIYPFFSIYHHVYGALITRFIACQWCVTV